MYDRNGIKLTTRDRVLRAWENSTDLVRAFQVYAHDIEDNEYLSKMFGQYAEEEALHASTLLQVLHEIESHNS